MMYVIDIFSDVKAILNSMSWKEKVFDDKKKNSKWKFGSWSENRKEK